MGYVHIDDAASCHLLAYQDDSAEGRYLCTSIVLEVPELAAFLAKHYPWLRIPTRLVVEKEFKANVFPPLYSFCLITCYQLWTILQFLIKFGYVFSASTTMCKGPSLNTTPPRSKNLALSLKGLKKYLMTVSNLSRNKIKFRDNRQCLDATLCNSK